MLDATTARRAPGPADWAWAAVGAAALLPITAAEVLREAGPAGTAWASVVLVLFVLLHLFVAVRPRWPRAAIAVASTLMLALAVLSLPGMPGLAVLQASSVVYLAFVYAAAASDDRVAGITGLALGLAGVGVITGVVLLSNRPSDVGMVASPGAVLALAGALGGGIGVAWALGRYRRETLRKRAAQELALEQAAELRMQGELRAVAEERRRIARELHDVIAHSLAVMVAQAEASRLLLGRDDERARGTIEHVVTTGRAAMGDMRGLLGALAAAPRGDSAPREPSPGLDALPALVERSQAPGRTAELEVLGVPAEVRPGVGLAAYRVVQESLTNTIRHVSPPTHSRVRIEWGDVLTVTIDDDGRDVAALRGSADGRGLHGMRDRVGQLGGGFEAGPRKDAQGWRVVARLPLGSDAHDEASR
ncbi:sensor histidine kinase [Agromyces italicus]|uniref:sensor histidine kinase n=1 Tax=Agromyces italicus TaxID=279572 RepID=UPI0012FCEE68|nr:histidine kinase [Agromyces italicus]